MEVLQQQDLDRLRGQWRIRRKFMFTVSGFCMVSVGYCLGMDLDSKVAETVVTMSYLVLGAIVSSYVFGATWEDISVARIGVASRNGGQSPHNGQG